MRRWRRDAPAEALIGQAGAAVRGTGLLFTVHPLQDRRRKTRTEDSYRAVHSCFLWI